MINITRIMIDRLNPFGYAMIGAGILLYIAKHDIADLLNSDGREVFLFSVVLIVYGTAIVLLNYLRGNRIEFGNAKYTIDELNMLRNSKSLIDVTSYFDSKLNEFEEKLDEINKSSTLLNDDEKIKIIENIKNDILSNTSSQVLDEIENKYSKNMEFSNQLKRVQEQLTKTQMRLKEEIAALSRRGNVNLVIGIITTMVAVWILATTIIDTNIKMTEEMLLTYYIPRLTLSLFIEIFSFFFLRLYKSGLDEIKYFQNELTNIEIKFVSLENAIHTKDKETIKSVISELSKTERNFILEKGQSTVDLERTKLDVDGRNNILDSLSKLVESIKK